MLELMLKGYEFPKCSLEGQSLPGRECGMKEKGLKPPSVLRTLFRVVGVESYRDVLLQDM